MMQATKHLNSKKGDEIWYIIGVTSSRSSSWALDRWRLYYPSYNTRVAVAPWYQICNNSDIDTDIYGRMFYTKPEQIIASAKFSSTNGFEHDFSFDLSIFPVQENQPDPDLGSVPLWILMSNLPKNAEFQQIYATPTGYSATRNKDAKILTWNFENFGVGLNVGGSDTSIIFDNQNLAMGIGLTESSIIKAKTVWFRNCELTYTDLDLLLNAVNRSSVMGGSLKYSGNLESPTVDSRAAYDSLIIKGWDIEGPIPPTS